jgi:hypothetical protein
MSPVDHIAITECLVKAWLRSISLSWKQNMERALLIVAMMGLVAASSPPSVGQGLADQGDQQVLIRNGFVVPPGKLLRIDDMSVDCVVASEVFYQYEFNRVGVETTAYLRIVYPVNACPEALDSEGECPSQDYVVGTVAGHGLRALFV